MNRKNCNSIIYVNKSELQNYISNNLYATVISETVNDHKITCDYFKNTADNNTNSINNINYINYNITNDLSNNMFH